MWLLTAGSGVYRAELRETAGVAERFRESKDSAANGGVYPTPWRLQVLGARRAPKRTFYCCARHGNYKNVCVGLVCASHSSLGGQPGCLTPLAVCATFATV